MKALIFLPIILVIAIYFMIQFIRKSKANKLTPADYEFLKSKMIIKNKELYTKLTIQKAQQFIDDYISERVFLK